MRVVTCVYMYACVHLYMYTRMYTHMYTYVYTTGGSAAGALSLAAATTREALRYHYDIQAPTIEDEALESALLAARCGACSALAHTHCALPHTLPPAPRPSVYEPIFRCVCVLVCVYRGICRC